MGKQLSMGKEKKKQGKALKVVTGQGSSLEGEERKGVRKSEKGRKQTTLISHLPPSPTRDITPVPSSIKLPFSRPPIPQFQVSLSLMLQVQSESEIQLTLEQCRKLGWGQLYRSQKFLCTLWLALCIWGFNLQQKCTAIFDTEKNLCVKWTQVVQACGVQGSNVFYFSLSSPVFPKHNSWS